MNKKKIIFVFGTRPEAIKLAPLISEFKKNENFLTLSVSTGQHKEMLQQVTSFFNINIDYSLDIMTKNQSLNHLSAKILISLKEVFEKENPDYVFVHGDTSTTAFGAIAAFYNKSKICHVEAGLRTFNKFSPFPEEINRTITGRLADFHFAPTQTAKQNLLNEGIPEKSIEITGNTVIDALMMSVKLTEKKEDIEIKKLKKIISKNKKTILVTGHRRENIGKGFENICSALREIANNKDVEIVYPVHLNPKVKDVVHSMLGNISNIHLIDPLSYPAFTWIMNQSYLILTDSGGVQEEAPSLGVPVLVLRDTTERPEGIKANTAILVGTEKVRIIDTVNLLLDQKTFYNKVSQSKNPYGLGDASKKIVTFMEKNG